MKIDTSSDTWKTITQHIEQTTDIAVSQLRTQAVSERDSDYLRGYLAALDELTALAQEKPAEPKKTVNPYK